MEASEQSPIQQVLGDVAELPETRALLSHVKPGSVQAVTGAGGSAKTLLVACIHAARRYPSLLICADAEAARRLETDLTTWLGDERVVLLPPREIAPLGAVAQSGEVETRRLTVLEALRAGEPVLVIAPLEAAAGLTPSPTRLDRLAVEVRVGWDAQPHDLARRLVEAGYRRVPLVENAGDFSLRGGLVDVYPPAGAPHRIEFGDDGVVSVRGFSIQTQKSTRPCAGVRLGAAAEWVLTSGDLSAIALKVRRESGRTIRRLEEMGRLEAAERLAARVQADLEKMDHGLPLPDAGAYAAYVEPAPVIVTDHLPDDALVFLDEPARLEQVAQHLEADRAGRSASLLESGGLLQTQTEAGVSFGDQPRLVARRSAIYLSRMVRRRPGQELTNLVALRYQAIPSFEGHWRDFMAEMARWRGAGDRVLLLAASDESAMALPRSLGELEIAVAERFSPGRPGGQVVVARGGLEEGFHLQGVRLRVVTEAQIRGRAPLRRRRRRAPELPEGVARGLTSYRELESGDYVVHVNHGIGVYLGIKSLEIEGVTRDYVFIKYEGEDRLYVSTDQIGLIQKYVGVEGQEPKIHRLSGTDWARAKKRARDSVRKLAVDLVKLYAVRQTLPGHPAAPDTPWQAEFEDGFQYEETSDQRFATEEIKRDMERPVPMDRLLCGDVGYGKTEVAMRAAFKAVTDGLQVAVLVPTTVLAQQHYATFKERFSGYPVKVDLLSRFRPRPRQDKTIRELRSGGVDVVIGTHRLLQADVTFKRLGLLIVDEEHRFGVGHKERLKELKTNVDVLVLTATPIPRTLNMALVGLRDMSVIDTPPEDRFPVQTYVVEHDEDLVREAVGREMARGGQVFYVHNRVESIQRAAARLQKLVPQARVAVAHGRMKEDALERVMMDFLEGEYDILVSTTIIESGLDLPNVNTLIVEEADKLGLAQLYQLRGRVGRSNRVAYAHFTYRPGRVISEVAEKRLEAIREFTELGSGHRIAMRDLEIRGAGNLLGAEQHGFMASVGFELYCRMLEEAVRELRGETGVPSVDETAVEVNLSAYIPDAYIPDSRQKIEAYHRIAGVGALADADDLEAELADRFGPLPGPVKNLLTVSRVRTVASSLGVTTVSRDPGGGLAVRMASPSPAVRKALAGLSGRYPGLLVRSSSQAMLFSYRPGRRPSLGAAPKGDGRGNVELLHGLLDLLSLIAERAKEPAGAGRL